MAYHRDLTERRSLLMKASKNRSRTLKTVNVSNVQIAIRDCRQALVSPSTPN
jgi:hypothetical protein